MFRSYCVRVRAYAYRDRGDPRQDFASNLMFPIRRGKGSESTQPRNTRASIWFRGPRLFRPNRPSHLRGHPGIVLGRGVSYPAALCKANGHRPKWIFVEDRAGGDDRQRKSEGGDDPGEKVGQEHRTERRDTGDLGFDRCHLGPDRLFDGLPGVRDRANGRRPRRPQDSTEP